MVVVGFGGRMVGGYSSKEEKISCESSEDVMGAKDEEGRVGSGFDLNN